MILFFISGPLTHTDYDGKTTIYGVVSGSGSCEMKDNCLKNGLYGRVSDPRILKWINEVTLQTL